MAIRTILVPLAGGEAEAGPLDTVMQIAKHVDAHVEALHVAEDPQRSLAYVGEGMTSSMIQEIIDTAEQREVTRTERACELFNAACAKHSAPIAETPKDAAGFSSRLTVVTGIPESIVATRGRLADLIAVCRPMPDDEATFSTIIEPALMESGCPVLVVPPGDPVIKLDRAAIAWNGGPEAGRAIRAATPLLQGMKEVRVIEVDEKHLSGPPLDDVLGYLSWHGISATTESASRNGRFVGDALLDAIEKDLPDVLIMGAHTRNRLRRMIFGDVTGEVLAMTPLPAFMAH